MAENITYLKQLNLHPGVPRLFVDGKPLDITKNRQACIELAAAHEATYGSEIDPKHVVNLWNRLNECARNLVAIQLNQDLDKEVELELRNALDLIRDINNEGKESTNDD